MNTLHRLAAAIWLSACCTPALAAAIHEDNREFLRQQENLSNQLHQQDNASLRQMLEQQIRQNAFVDAAREYLMAHPEALAPMCKTLEIRQQGNMNNPANAVKGVQP
ncbi:hypothetical protein QRZ34_28200 [Klebsiella michiganensis]|uniref:hypothetical protein n=1 Tax=Klebsiella michiganensis TaxID=1134687 RepID=UPI002570DC6C|nr:hypothetical protein [Klebsiella michiganensis]MDL4454898.1 hypothetical protein [Klebsiella michiganensis]